MFDIEDARLQYEALKGAAEVSPVLQVKARLVQMGNEWARAGGTLKMLSEPIVDEDTGEVVAYQSDEWAIEIAGAVVNGMQIASESPGNDLPYHVVIRQMAQHGQLSLHVSHTRLDAGTYINLAGPESPVVVRIR